MSVHRLVLVVLEAGRGAYQSRTELAPNNEKT
jgi:hypothetical protein